MALQRAFCRSSFLYKGLDKRCCTLFQRQNSQVTQDQADNHYDIIIAGGGMVGCTLACLFAKKSILSNLKILLLEGSTEQTFKLKDQYSNRVSALNQNTKSLMESIGAWKLIENMRVQPIRSMQVWDACSDAFITFNDFDINADVAYIVENDVLLHAVNTQLKSKNNLTPVDIVYGAKIADYELPNSVKPKTEVKMENGDIYSCTLLIGADGASSKVRKSMGVQYLSGSYGQMGVVATLELAEEDTNNNTAWQRFLPSGPVAVLPLSPRHSSLVWCTGVPHARELLDMPEEQFVDALNDALIKEQLQQQIANFPAANLGCDSQWHDHQQSVSVRSGLNSVKRALAILGGQEGARRLPPSIRAASSRAAFPLGFGHSTRYVDAGVALVGDAAHRVHPLAGQGVNLGFGDIKELVHQMCNSVYSGEHLGGQWSWLSQYETVRQRHVIATQLGVHALAQLYSTDAPPAVLVRGLATQLAQSLAPLKKAIMSHATT